MMDALLDYEVATLVMGYETKTVDMDDWSEPVDLADMVPTAVIIRPDGFMSFYEFAPSDDPVALWDVLSRLKELNWNVEILIPADAHFVTVRLNGPNAACRAVGATYMEAVCRAAVEAVL